MGPRMVIGRTRSTSCGQTGDVRRERACDDEAPERPRREGCVELGEASVAEVGAARGARDRRSAKARVGAREAIALEPRVRAGARIVGLAEAMQQHEQRHLIALRKVLRHAQREPPRERAVAPEDEIPNLEVAGLVRHRPVR